MGLWSLGGRRIERRGSRTSLGRRKDPCAVRQADQRSNGTRYRCDVGDRVNSVCSDIAAGGGGNAAAEAHSPSGALEDHDADAPLMAFANDCDGWVRVMQCDGALLVTGSGVFAGPRWDVLFALANAGAQLGGAGALTWAVWASIFVGTRAKTQMLVRSRNAMQWVATVVVAPLRAPCHTTNVRGAARTQENSVASRLSATSATAAARRCRLASASLNSA